MKIAAPRRLATAVLALLAAWGCSGPVSPSPPPPVQAAPVPTPPPSNFPPLSGPSRVFVFDHELTYPVRDYTRASRLVLYDNGAFALQYPSLGTVAYRGGYSAANGEMTFEWEGWSTAGAWGATAALTGDALTMRYNLIMQLSDFEDAAYVLAR